MKQIDANMVNEELLNSAVSSWDEAIDLTKLYGVRNSQVSLLAPTGTIGLMMDCDTTGIEPDLGLVKVKKLVGGGVMSIVNQTVPRALESLGYNVNQIKEIIKYIDTEKTIINAPNFDTNHLPVFACSMGDNTIHYSGHIKMMAAVQPFLSGAISKTVNLPEEVSVDEIQKIYLDSWKMGLKAVALYRDNCKVAQPLSTEKRESTNKSSENNDAGKILIKSTIRRRLPRVRMSKTYKFQISDLKGYFTVGQFEDGTPGELFISVSKQGSTLSGLMDSFAISVSHGLQYGVPLKSYVKTLRGTSFAPSGSTNDPEIKVTTSIVDYISRRLALDYLSFDDQLELGIISIDDLNNNSMDLQANILESESKILDDELSLLEKTNTISSNLHNTNNFELNQSTNNVSTVMSKTSEFDSSAPLCFNCGNQTQRAGSCYVCSSCGSTTGCS